MDLGSIHAMCMQDMVLWLVGLVLVILLGFGAVAFITLLERKFLGLSQIRIGPNKVSEMGLLQPVRDGVKLLFKQLFILNKGQLFLFVIRPRILLVNFILIWCLLVPWRGTSLFKYGALLFFAILGVRSYSVILAGWGRTSVFSKLGRLRGLLQNLSFEVALILVFFCVLTSVSSFSVFSNLGGEGLIFVWSAIWVVLSLLESNRAPFDLLEGESELIRGFNVEMGSLTFVYLFLREYGMVILIIIIFCSVMFVETKFLVLFLSSLILVLRSCYPRIRYDIIMTFIWERLLPLRVFLFLVEFCL